MSHGGLHIRVLLFASLRDVVGARSVDLHLPAGSTVRTCIELLGSRHPGLPERLARSRVAVGENLVGEAHVLREGDEVAFLPPVSGGAPEDGEGEVWVSEAPISLDRIIRDVRRPDCGGIVLFIGTVRNHFEGQAVRGIEYEAHSGLACRALEDLVKEARARWPLGAVSVAHRTGWLDVGDIAVAVAVSAGHRAEAFEAARHLIDAIKEVVPVWKREALEGGDVWIEGDERIPARPTDASDRPGRAS